MSRASLAFVFPGQGSQAVGMGAALIESSPAARARFELADSILGFALTELCLNGPAERLTETQNAQPALLTGAIAALDAYRESGGPEAEFTAGHSLGEYSSLVAAGSIAFDHALGLVRKRGDLMARAATKWGGAMTAILGLDALPLAQLCINDQGTVDLANLNAPGQIVISGESDAVERVSAAAMQAGARRAVRLPVSGAFHSTLMASAAAEYRGSLADIPMAQPRMTVYSNVTAQPVSDPEELPRLLTEQIVSRVRWEESVREMIAEGVRTFIEFGPGKVLCGLIRRIDPSVQTANVEDPDSLAAAVKLARAGDEDEV